MSDGDTIKVDGGTYKEGLTVSTPNITIEVSDPSDPPILDGSESIAANATWTQEATHIWSTDYTWPHTQLTDTQFTQNLGGYDQARVALQVFENGILLRGYRNRQDPDYTSGVGGPYRTMAELGPTNDNGGTS